jgi:methionine-rich copper-binding protein CopC
MRSLSRTKNLLFRAVALVFAVAALLLAGTQPADAHNVLVSSDPAKGVEVQSGPSQVELTFNEPVESGFNELTILGPDKKSHWENGAATVQAEKISVPLRPLGPAGVYTVSYHIVSEDGHPVSGSYTFTLTVAGSGTAAPQGQSAVAGAPSASDSASVPVWVWPAGAAVLLVAGIVIARRIAR